MQRLQRHHSYLEKQARLGAIMSSPLIIFMTVFSIIPFLSSFFLCFTNFTLLKPTFELVGLQNFKQIVGNRKFTQAIQTTFILTFGCVSATVLLSLLYTLVLSFDIPGKSIIKAIILLPWVMPDIIVGYTWKMLFTVEYGVVYKWMCQLGMIEQGTALFRNVAFAQGLIIACFAWCNAPFSSIMMYAQVKAIPTSHVEAAKIDGANSLQRLRYIIFPWLLPVMKHTFILQLCGAFNNYTIIASLTGGGPGTSTSTMPVMLQTTAFSSHMFGKGSAYAVMILIVLGGSFLIAKLIGMLYQFIKYGPNRGGALN